MGDSRIETMSDHLAAEELVKVLLGEGNYWHNGN